MTVASIQPEWAADVIDLLDQQCGIYEQLHEMSAEQTRYVETGEAELLLTLLARRQQLIDHLSQLNGRIEPYKQDWPTRFAGLAVDVQEQLQVRINRVQTMLDQIVAQDERDRAELAKHRDRVGGEMGQVRQGAVINKAYGRPGGAASSSPRFTDQAG